MASFRLVEIAIALILLTGCAANKETVHDTQLMSKRERTEVIEFMFIMNMCEGNAIEQYRNLETLGLPKKNRGSILYVIKNGCISEYYLQKIKGVGE